MLFSVIEHIKQTKNLIVNKDLHKDFIVKGKADYVTSVDFAVQNFLEKELTERFPEIQFMGEESENNNIDLSKPTWVLDPIDGTTNLIHDYKMSAVALGLIQGGEPILGVVYNPFTDEMFYAEKGKGAFLNGEKITVCDAQNIHETVVSIGTSPYEKYRAEDNFKIFKNIFLAAQDIRRSGSAELDICYVAAGRIGGYLERGLKPWDYVAGSIILLEAGGNITDWNGVKIKYGKASDVICTNGKIHSELMELTEIGVKNG